MKLPLVEDKYGGIKDQDGDTPMLTGFALSCGQRSRQAEENTEKVVRAVNSHERLTEALQAVIEMVDNDIVRVRPSDYLDFAETLELLHSALAAAKGEPNV